MGSEPSEAAKRDEEQRLETLRRSLMLPDPPDPLDELFREAFAESRVNEIGGYHAIEKRFRAELARRGYKLVKETHDD